MYGSLLTASVIVASHHIQLRIRSIGLYLDANNCVHDSTVGFVLNCVCHCVNALLISSLDCSVLSAMNFVEICFVCMKSFRRF